MSKAGPIVTPDLWSELRRFTQARISLGRCGVSLPLAESLAFRLAHAQARDAVWQPFRMAELAGELEGAGLECLRLHSAVADRGEYLTRPDKGRRLDEASRELLAARAAGAAGGAGGPEGGAREPEGASRASRNAAGSPPGAAPGASPDVAGATSCAASHAAPGMAPGGAPGVAPGGASGAAPNGAPEGAPGVASSGAQGATPGGVPDVVLVVGDGLSARAVHETAGPLVRRLVPVLRGAGLSVGPVCLVENARVAVADEVGALLGARVSVILIGERPGLSSPNSLGIYLTHGPRPGTTDEARNCISNVRPGGLSLDEAVRKLAYLLEEALALGLSGVALKDKMPPAYLPFGTPAPPALES
ncbi:ethanolamine ammonia-lyase subunit EutC [Desulfocurvus vexinensis]|uniref:ethanolamine ammonia-lyase subunit EutC n=1 Tax=Desulfocurvus vexinensis TaxID=399548 RepID=UPI00048A9789|nr:ethanolamine ammonia-lyase subunit EutC [Desulfocurvus vexinensis]